MLDLVLLQVLLDPFCNEVWAVVRDDCLRDPISGDNVVSDNPLCHRSCDRLIGGCFHPLSEIVYRYQNEAMTIRCSRVYSADDINPLGGEGPWRGHAMQFLRGSVHKITMDLAVVASTHKLATVCLHG